MVDKTMFEEEHMDLGDGWVLTRIRMFDRPIYPWSWWFVQHGKHDCNHSQCVKCDAKIPMKTKGLALMLNGLDSEVI